MSKRVERKLWETPFCCKTCKASEYVEDAGLKTGVRCVWNVFIPTRKCSCKRRVNKYNWEVL